MEGQRLSIYEKTELEGPVTKKHKRRLWAIYTVWAFIGFLPTLLGKSWRWQIAGLGFAVPGGGFLALGGVSGIVLFLISAVLMLKAIHLWQKTGFQVYPFILWALEDILCVTALYREPAWPGSGGWICLAVILLYVVVTRIHNRNMNARELKKQAERLEYYKQEIPAEEAIAAGEVADGDFELTEEQLRQQKYLFDLIFGPFGEFQGFTFPDRSQIPLSGLRYQLNSMMNTIQQIQCQYTPNFYGFASEAQRRCIELYRLPRVWRYWRTENLLGSFRFDGNPIAKDNVMMTGFFLVNVTMYMRNTGDMRYTEPGSLTFQNGKEKYAHDVHTVADAIVWNWDHRDYVMYPCEPNFCFSLCNWKAIQSMISYEKLFHNGKWVRNADRVYNAFVEEMASPSGSCYAIKSTRTGCGITGMTAADTFMVPLYNTEDPVLARQTYAFFRQDSYERDKDGTLFFKATPSDHGYDANVEEAKNYCDGVSTALLSAWEMGDREAEEALRRVLEEKCEKIEENGAIRYRCSTEVNAVLLQAFINTRNGWRRAVVDGPAACTVGAPLLSEAPYPDVMVAKAFSHGTDLELVLYPFDKAGCESELGLSRLVPGGQYVVEETGARFTADENGNARQTVTLLGRTPLHIVPV